MNRDAGLATHHRASQGRSIVGTIRVVIWALSHLSVSALRP